MLIKTITRMNKTHRSRARRVTAIVVAVTLAAVSLPGAAWADERDHWRGDDHEHWRGDNHEHWHGDLPRFHEFDLDHWRSAHWWHGLHDGRDGWWWVLDGAWYWYPSPIYPYPDPYRPPVVVVPNAPPSGPLWYFCRSPQGYYPYVANCLVPWQPVTPTR